MVADARAERRIEWLSRLGALLVRVLGWTWRVRVAYDDDVRRMRADGKPIVFMIWHGQMLPLLYHHRNEHVAVLISEHGRRDHCAHCNAAGLSDRAWIDIARSGSCAARSRTRGR